MSANVSDSAGTEQTKKKVQPDVVKAVLSHPLRVQILRRVIQEPASPVALATDLHEPLGNVAYHVRTLFDLGLLTLVGTHQRRGATEHIYGPMVRKGSSAWDRLQADAMTASEELQGLGIAIKGLR